MPHNGISADGYASTMETAYFDRFTLELPIEAVTDCSHSGRCDEDVEHWAPKITRPAECTREALAAELKEFGAWDASELENDVINWQRIVWIAAGNIKESRN